MDAETIIKIISTVGFPIAMCVFILWFLIKEQNDHKAEMERMLMGIEMYF